MSVFSRSLLCLALLTLSAGAAVADDDTKLRLSPTGRLLIDGAVFVSPDKDQFKDGMAVPDVRLGVKGVYGKWTGKIDVGYNYGKVGLRDLIVQYNFNPGDFICVGNFIHQYGYQPPSGSSLKPSFEEPTSSVLFSTGRQLGMMYVHSADKYFGTLSFHVEPNSVTTSPNDMHGEGVGVLTRQLFRPIIKADGTMLQAGISAGFATPQHRGDTHDGFSFTATFPTRVNRVTAQAVTLGHSLNMWKFSPELMAAYGPVALEAQYFFNRVNKRDHLRSFTGQGVYAELRGLITGGHYSYDPIKGIIATPRAKSLELTLLYNYASLSDDRSQYINDDGLIQTGIYGGRTNTFSATLSYYINRYFLARLNYTYTHRWDSQSLSGFNTPTDFNALQARIQFIF